MDSVSNVGVRRQGRCRAPRPRAPMLRADSPSCRRRPGCHERPPIAWPTALEQHGLVRRDADGRFCLGLALVGLGHAAADALPARRPRPTRPRRAPRRDGRERAAVRPRGRRPALRGVAAVAPRPALDRRRGCPAAAATVGSAGQVLTGELGPDGWVESVEEREAGCGVGQRTGDRRRRAGRGRGQRQRPGRAPQPATGATVR